MLKRTQVAAIHIIGWIKKRTINSWLGFIQKIWSYNDHKKPEEVMKLYNGFLYMAKFCIYIKWLSEVIIYWKLYNPNGFLSKWQYSPGAPSPNLRPSVLWRKKICQPQAVSWDRVPEALQQIKVHCLRRLLKESCHHFLIHCHISFVFMSWNDCSQVDARRLAGCSGLT